MPSEPTCVPIPLLSVDNSSEPFSNDMSHYQRATAVAIGEIQDLLQRNLDSHSFPSHSGFIMINAGGILSIWIFNDAPRYHKACTINLAFSVGIVLATAMNVGYLVLRDTQRQGVMLERNLPQTARVDVIEDEEDKKRLGDQQPAFVYTL